MFISFGKMLGKGKLRLGVGFKITKSNVLWMGFIALLYYCFMMVFWLFYVMCYFMFWPFKLLFRKRKKNTKNNKVKAESKNVDLLYTEKIETNANVIDEKTAQSDYTKAVFLWGNKTSTPIKKRNEYPAYLFYECSIQDAAKYHEKMITEGYLVVSSPKEKILGLKVDELKDILASQGLKVSGKKSELIERISNNVSDEILSEYVKEETYSLSDLGKKFLEDNNDYVLLHTHKNWGIDWKEYDLNKKQGTVRNFYDICWGIFNKRILEDKEHLGRNEYLNMHELLMEEKKYKLALEELLRVFYLDICGYSSNSLMGLNQGFYDKKELKANFSRYIFFAPGIVKGIGDLFEYYESDMARRVAGWKLPFSACSADLFVEIVESIIHGSFNEESTMKKLKIGYENAIDKF